MREISYNSTPRTTSRETERKYGTREFIPKIDHKVSNPKARKRLIAINRDLKCHGRNPDRDVGDEINGGDDDGNPTKFDASWGRSRRKSRESQRVRRRNRFKFGNRRLTPLLETKVTEKMG